MRAAELVFSELPSAGRRPPLRALSYALVSLAIGLILVPGLTHAFPRFAQDGHMHISFSQAVNSTFCRSLSLSTVFDIPDELTAHPDELDEPIATLIGRRAGSMETYCQSLRRPLVNNENSLMLLMRAILLADADVSAAGIGRTLSAARLLIVLVLCFALFSAGASVLTGVSLAVAACCVLRSLAPYQYNNNPFILALPLLLIAVYVMVLNAGARRTVTVASIFAGLGLLTAFCINMRNSHTPIYLGLFALFAIAWRRPVRQSSPEVPARLLLIALSMFAVVLVGGHVALLYAVDKPGAEGAPRHGIAHPLVLSLALTDPPSDLSRREGLRWDDLRGFEIAHRVDPSARYLSPAYERALGRYYMGLWRTHPVEMLEIYGTKFQTAGRGVLLEAALALEHRWIPSRVTAWLGRQDVSGLALLALALGTTLAGWMSYRRTASLVAFAWTLVSVASVGTLLEAAIIVPQFYVFYHGVLLLYVLMTPAALVQFAIDCGRDIPALAPSVR